MCAQAATLYVSRPREVYQAEIDKVVRELQQRQYRTARSSAHAVVAGAPAPADIEEEQQQHMQQQHMQQASRQQQQFQLLQVMRPLHMEMYTPGQQIYVTDSHGHLFAAVVPIDLAPGATFCVRAPIMSRTSAPTLARRATAPAQQEITATALPPAVKLALASNPTAAAPVPESATAAEAVEEAEGGRLAAATATVAQRRWHSGDAWVSLPPATTDSELSSTALVTTARPSIELHTALVSAQIQAELAVGKHMYAEQWARPAVQWGGVQWDASLEMAIAAELFQPSALAELFQSSAHPLPLHD